MSLKHLRQNIAKIDVQLVKLLNERARQSLQIFMEKQRSNLPVYNQQREDQVIQNVIQQNKGPLTSEQLKSIFEIIIESCRTIQQKQERL